MKKICPSFLFISIVVLCMLSVQDVFGTIIIRKDDPIPGGVPMVATRLNTFYSIPNSIIPVSADLNDSELIIDFNSSIGIATITIENQNGDVVYQDLLDTNSELETNIETGGYDSGNFTLRVSYGSTKLIGDFQL